MVSSDTIVGIVGAVILTGAMIAVFYYEADREEPVTGGIGTGDEQYDFQFVDREQGGPSDSTLMDEGDTWEQSWELPPYSVGVHVEVSWSHPLQDTELVGQPGYLIEVLDEDGEVVHEADASPLHHEMDDEKAFPPSMTITVNADSQAEAEELRDDYMQREEVTQNARDWSVRVTLVDDGQAAPDPTGQLDDLRWTMEVETHAQFLFPELSS